MSGGFDERITTAEPVDIADGDQSTSPEALTVLREQGVDAWLAWTEKHH